MKVVCSGQELFILLWIAYNPGSQAEIISSEKLSSNCVTYLEQDSRRIKPDASNTGEIFYLEFPLEAETWKLQECPLQGLWKQQSPWT